MAEPRDKDESNQVKVIDHIKSCCLATCHAGQTADPPGGQLNDLIVTNRLSNEVVVDRYCFMLLLDAEDEKYSFSFPVHNFDTVATGNIYDTEIVLIDNSRNTLTLGKLSLETSLWSLKFKPTPVVKVHKTIRDVMTVIPGNQGEPQRISYVAIDTNKQTIFMSDYHGHGVKVFTYNRDKMSGPIRETNIIGSYGNQNGELKYPCGVAIDRESKCVMVADSGNDRISVFGYNGVFKGHVLKDAVKNPRGLAYDAGCKLLAVTMFGQGLLSHNSVVTVYEQRPKEENSKKSCIIS